MNLKKYIVDNLKNNGYKNIFNDGNEMIGCLNA